SACPRSAIRSAQAPPCFPRRAWRACAAAARDRPATRRATRGTTPSRAQPPRPPRRRPPARARRAPPRSRGSGPCSPALVLSICARLRDERLEELPVLAGFRMPEDAEREAPSGVLDSLDRPVVRPGDLAQAFPHAAETLMMRRLHGSTVADHGTKLRVVVDPNGMLGEHPSDLAMRLVADEVGEVLHEVAA